MSKARILMSVAVCGLLANSAAAAGDTYLRFENLDRKVTRLEASVKMIQSTLSRIETKLSKIEQKLATKKIGLGAQTPTRAIEKQLTGLQRSVRELTRLLSGKVKSIPSTQPRPKAKKGKSAKKPAPAAKPK